MKTNWTQTVNTINRKRFTIPEGWDTRDQVADSLQCDPSKVAEILKPGIATGDIERQEFPVWDEKRRLTVRVMCYRLAGEKKPTVKPARGASIDDRIRQAIAKYPKKSSRDIAKNIFGATSAMVEEVRKQPKS